MLKDMQSVLEYAFDVFNQVYFDSALPSIVISIMSSRKTNGHFTINKTWRVGDEYTHEINVSAEHLDRPIENICATLMHEMVHYFCALNDIHDTSKNYRYHNKLFKEEAEKRDLIIDYDKYIGYSITEPGPGLIETIHANGIEKPLDINREEELISLIGGVLGIIGPGGTDGDTDNPNVLPVKPKSSTRKYQCPCCGNSVRATKDLSIICGDCQVEFIKVEKK